MIECSYPECKNSIKDHAWGKIKAEGWLFQKNDTQWCPDHIPDWVNSWRKRKHDSKV